MKRFKDPSVLFLWVLSLAMVIFLLQPYVRGEEAKEMPGPDLHDGFGLVATEENPNAPNTIFKEYSRKEENKPEEMVLVVVIKETNEAVLVGWNVTKENDSYNEGNMRIAIKLESGIWLIGKKGVGFYVNYASNEKGEKFTIFGVEGEDDNLYFGKLIKQ